MTTLNGARIRDYLRSRNQYAGVAGSKFIKELCELALFGLACREAKVVEALGFAEGHLMSCCCDPCTALARLDELLKEGT